MQLIDLSVSLNEQTPVYPGDPPTKIEPAGTIQESGFRDSYISFDTHLGTHIDAPAHVLTDGQSLEKFPLERLIGRGRSISIKNKVFDLEDIKQQDIQADDIVLFHTGMSNEYLKPAYFDDYPKIPDTVANYLVACGVKMVGVDMCSVDHDQPIIHKIFLSAGVLIIENLTNLASLSGKQFTVYALPLKFALDGSPARVIAQIENLS
jgi:kynurenine formamidase